MNKEEIKEFRADLLQTSYLEASVNMEFNRSEFIRIVVNDLIEFEECTDFTPCYYEGTGIKGRKIEIDGYNFDEDDNTLSVFICFYSGNEEMPTITKSDIDRLCDRAINFIHESFSGTIQKNVDESTETYDIASHILDIHDIIERYRVYLISDHIKSDKIKQIDLETIDGKSTKLSLWDVSNIYELKISKMGYNDIEIDFSKYNSKGISCIKATELGTTNYDSYLCIMPGKLLSDLFEDYGGRLLEANVRSFLRLTTKTNKNIRATILKEPDMFFSYNNGITTTATDLEIDNTSSGPVIKKITSLQIVNGGQTTVTLFTVGKSRDNPDLSPIFVPMKITVIPPGDAEEIVPKISRSANTQNKVSEADFFSNHPFHREIERYSRSIKVRADGLAYSTRWYYERARGQYQQDQLSLTPGERKKFQYENPKTQYFTKTDLSKYWNSYSGHPEIVSRGAQYSFLEYAKEISEGWIVNKAKYNELYFKNSISLAILFRKTEKIISNQPWYNGGYRANIVTYTIAKMSDMIKAIDGALDLEKIWIQQDLPEILEQQISKLSEQIYISITSDNKEANVAQWCKKSQCWHIIKNLKLDLIPGMEKCLISEKKSRWETKTATREQKQTNNMHAQIEVVNLGYEYWRHLYEWGIEHALLDGYERDIIRTCLKLEERKYPSDKQSAEAIRIRNKLRDDGYTK